MHRRPHAAGVSPRARPPQGRGAWLGRFGGGGVVNESGAFGGGVEPVLGGRARVKRMAWIFGLTVAVRIVYFLVMAPYTADWDPKPIQRNGFLSIARSVL